MSVKGEFDTKLVSTRVIIGDLMVEANLSTATNKLLMECLSDFKENEITTLSAIFESLNVFKYLVIDLFSEALEKCHF